MPLNIRIDGDLAILSNFGRLLNDPRHFDASRDVRELLDEGRRNFVLELASLRELSPTSLGLLTTLTRLVRQYDGEVVLANVSQAAEDYIEMMHMDTYWDIVESVEDARAFFGRGEDRG
jgi:anti-sigma B factor antagonist